MGKYLEKEKIMLTEITNFCKNKCLSNFNCPEEECILYRIEKIITDGK